MTADELQFSFREKIANLGDPNLVSSFSISQWLTDGQQEVIEDLIKSGLNDEKSFKSLGELLYVGEAVPSVYTGFPNSQVVTLNTTVYQVLIERCDIVFSSTSILTGTRTNVQIKPISLDFYNANKDNDNKNPYYDLVWRMDIDESTGKRILLINDGTFTVSKYYYKGLKRPTAINIVGGVGCMLDAQLHPKVVEKAVKAFKLYKGDLNSAQLMAVEESK